MYRAKNQLEVGEGGAAESLFEQRQGQNDQRSCLDKYSSPHICLYLHRALEAAHTQYRAAQTIKCLFEYDEKLTAYV